MKTTRCVVFFVAIVTAACHADPVRADDEPERAPAQWWGGRVLLDALDWLDLTHGVDDLEECKRGRARDREEAVSVLAAAQAAHAIAIAEERGRTERADARADGIEAAGRRAAEAARRRDGGPSPASAGSRSPSESSSGR